MFELGLADPQFKRARLFDTDGCLRLGMAGEEFFEFAHHGVDLRHFLNNIIDYMCENVACLVRSGSGQCRRT